MMPSDRLVALTRHAAALVMHGGLRVVALWLCGATLAGLAAGLLVAVLAVPSPPDMPRPPVESMAAPPLATAPTIVVEALPPPDAPVAARITAGPAHKPAEIALLFFHAMERAAPTGTPRSPMAADLPRHGGGDGTLRRQFAAAALAAAEAATAERERLAIEANAATEALLAAQSAARAQVVAAEEARRAAEEALAQRRLPHPGPAHRPAEIYLLLARVVGPDAPPVHPAPGSRDPGRFGHALPEPERAVATLSRPGQPHTMPEVVLLYAALAARADHPQTATISVRQTGWLAPPVPGERPAEPDRSEVAITETGPGPAIEMEPLAPPTVPATAPLVAIIIDDMGLNARRNERVAALPGPLTLAYIPYGEGLGPQTRLAAASGHEIFLHLPMQPLSADEDPGPHALLAGLDPGELAERLAWNLDRFDGYVGVNNHMGSLLTQDAAAMETVMAELSRRGVLFVDSVTSAGSVAYRTAQAWGIPSARRDLFLDNVPEVEAVTAQLDHLEQIARTRGMAIGIGHPHDATLAALAAWLPHAAERGLVLVPVSRIIERSQVNLAETSEIQ